MMADEERCECQSSAHGLGPANAPSKRLRTGCAKNATRKGAREKLLLTAMPDGESVIDRRPGNKQ